MLYLDGELVNTRLNKDGKAANPKFEKQAQEYKEVLTHINDYFGDTLVVETRTKPHPDPITGYPVYPGTRGILLQTTIATDDGMEEWVYSPNILKKEDDVLKMEKPNLLIQKGSYSIDVKRNPDLAFYLFKCNKVGKNEFENKKYHFVDLQASTDHKAEQNRTLGKVMNMIYTSIPEDRLRTMAKSWGVPGVNIKDISNVREELYQIVLAGEEAKEAQPGVDRRGYKEFINSSDVKMYDQIAALCSDAEERGKLVFDIDRRSWTLEYGDGSSPSILKELAGDEFGRPMDALVDFLLAEREELRRVENLMGTDPMQLPSKELDVKTETETAEGVPDNLSVDLIENTKKRPDLMRLVKEHCSEYKIQNTDTNETLRSALFRKVAANNIVQEPIG